MEKVGEAIIALQKNKGVKIEDLQTNDPFIDTVIQATHIAYRNSQDEKREALKNAIINSGFPNPPEQSLQQMFVNWIDVFTIWHLRILFLYQDPEKWLEINNCQIEKPHIGEPSIILVNAYPEMKNREDFYNLIWNELYQRGLVDSDNTVLQTGMVEQEIFEKRTTELADEFLSFINQPEL